MINSISQSPAFGSRCAIVLDKHISNARLIDHLKKVDPSYNLKYVDSDVLRKRPMANGEFTIIGQMNLKNSNLKEIHIEDNGKSYYRLMAMLNSLSKDFKKPFKVIGLG